MNKLVEKAKALYNQHEQHVEIAVFVLGFLFDAVTLSSIDDLFSITQQIVYLALCGLIIYYDILTEKNLLQLTPKMQKIWHYRDLALHFVLGSLLSIYSLFFFKSSSSLASLVFVFILILVMIANELSFVQKRADLKVALFVLCLLSFISMMVPVALGFVGWIPFVLSLTIAVGAIFLIYKQITKKIDDRIFVQKRWMTPALAVPAIYFVLYLFAWIPPVPLSVESMGVYHQIEKNDGNYRLWFEKTWWKFWQKDDGHFTAEPGDKIFVFVKVFSPARFDDTVILHWYFKDPQQGWLSTDKIPMRVTGGRENGYRGFSVKQNYQPGDWRVSVETTNEREIGRWYFEVESASTANSERIFENIIQ